VVKKIWHFIGLPDPEENVERKKLTNIQKNNQIAKNEDEKKPVEIETTVQSELPKTKINWDGPITPKGEPFHDLGLRVNSSSKKIPSNALRYVTPNSMNRLPIDSMATRLYQGDVVVVDLSVMVHMDSQQRACRQSLRQLSSERGIPVWSLDQKDSLLLLPGKNIVIDRSKYDLI
tara:strand:+ start:122 stop:646 length:525 start_codon:yes stop_codon:yes gene_type:complete